jgi:hypothetical protein
MKTPLAFLALAAGLAVTTQARPVDVPSLDELWRRADLVVVLAPTNTMKTADQFPQAGEPVRPAPPSRGSRTGC